MLAWLIRTTSIPSTMSSGSLRLVIAIMKTSLSFDVASPQGCIYIQVYTFEQCIYNQRDFVSPPFEKYKQPQPIYLKIKDDIRSQIDSGELSPGDRVPSESEIVKRVGASRMTVNRALKELAHEGKLVRVQGLGTFVAERRPQATLLHINDISDEISNRGGVHSSRQLQKGVQAATVEIAHLLGITPAMSVFHIMLLHEDNKKAIQIENRYVNSAVAPNFLDQDFSEITPSRYLLKKYPVSEIEHKIEARLPDVEEQELLGIGSGEPCLSMLRRSWTYESIVTCVRLTSPGKLFTLGGRSNTQD
jgi:GntR family histidine utilization transcriptional repressor